MRAAHSTILKNLTGLCFEIFRQINWIAFWEGSSQTASVLNT
jgi:hypothetical protein